MLFRLSRDGKETPFSRLEKRAAANLGLEEKDLENWLARHPALLFGGEQVFVVGQSVCGRSMADLLALDADGNLVIVEIKRDWSDRETVGQLLEYAADTWNWKYDRLNALYEHYRDDDSPGSVLDGFRRLSDNECAQQDDTPKGYRLCIVAPESDDGLKRIIRWLQQFGVPISFIPFALYVDVEAEVGEILLEIEQLRRDDPRNPVVGVDESHGDWIHNTNETNAPGAYKKRGASSGHAPVRDLKRRADARRCARRVLCEHSDRETGPGGIRNFGPRRRRYRRRFGRSTSIRRFSAPTVRRSRKATGASAAIF